MSPEGLESLARALRPIEIDESWPEDARRVAKRFNDDLVREHGMLECARAAVAAGQPIPAHVVIALRGLAVLYSAERKRLSRRLPRVSRRGKYR